MNAAIPRSAISVTLVVVLAGAGVASAAQASSRLELSLKGVFTPSAAGSTYRHFYDPHPGYEIPGSYARQTLAVVPGPGWGLKAGLTVPLGKALEVRFTLARETVSFGGENGPFEVFYKYSTWTPLLERVDGSRLTFLEWPATAGRLQNTSASLELGLRLRLNERWVLRFAAGPCFSILGGEIYPLGYEEVIYERFGYQIFRYSFVLLRLPPKAAPGIATEAELAFQIDRRVSLVLGTAFQTGSYNGTPEIRAAYDYHSLLDEPAELLDRLKSRVSPGPLEIGVSALRLSFGIAIGL